MRSSPGFGQLLISCMYSLITVGDVKMCKIFAWFWSVAIQLFSTTARDVKICKIFAWVSSVAVSGCQKIFSGGCHFDQCRIKWCRLQRSRERCEDMQDLRLMFGLLLLFASVSRLLQYIYVLFFINVLLNENCEFSIIIGEKM